MPRRLILAAALSALMMGAPPAFAMPNPASVACVNGGGRLEIRKDQTGGEYGVCHMRDGRLCEEWALFRDHRCALPGDAHAEPAHRHRHHHRR